MREIMEVPLPLAASRDLISFLTWEGKNVRTLKIGNLSVIWGKLTYLPDFNILVSVLRILTHFDSGGVLVVVGGGVIEAGRQPPRTSQALKVHYLVKLVKCMVWLKSYIKALGRALWLVVMNFCIKWREKIKIMFCLYTNAIIISLSLVLIFLQSQKSKVTWISSFWWIRETNSWEYFNRSALLKRRSVGKRGWEELE